MNDKINQLEDKNRKANDIIHQLDNEVKKEKANCENLKDELEDQRYQKELDLTKVMQESKIIIDEKIKELSKYFHEIESRLRVLQSISFKEIFISKS